MGALLAGPRRHQTTPRPRQDRPLKKYHFFIKNVDFSLEKCRFGAHRGVLHYVLRRKRVILRKNDNFELEICVKARGGRAARCMGSVPVADLLASEARGADQDMDLETKMSIFYQNHIFSFENVEKNAPVGSKPTFFQ